MYYQNVRSIRNRLKDLACNIPLANYDVILFTETWLSDDIYDAVLGFHNYQVYRCDRNSMTSKKQRGGGVLIAVKKSIHSEIVKINNNPIETLFIIIKFKSQKIVLNCTYIPPQSPHDVYEKYTNLLDDILSRYNDDKKIIFADFNLPHLSWHSSESDTFLIPYNSNTLSGIILCSMSFNDLVQINSQRNEKGRLLDLVYVNDLSAIITSPEDDDILVKTDSHHPPLLFSITLYEIKAQPVSDRNVINCFSKTDFNSFKSYLSDIKWHEILEDQSNLDSALEFFYSTVQEGIDKFVPKITITNSHFPKWYSLELREKII